MILAFVVCLGWALLYNRNKASSLEIFSWQNNEMTTFDQLLNNFQKLICPSRVFYTAGWFTGRIFKTLVIAAYLANSTSFPTFIQRIKAFESFSWEDWLTGMFPTAIKCF